MAPQMNNLHIHGRKASPDQQQGTQEYTESDVISEQMNRSMDTAYQALQSIVQFHFERTLEKKKDVDLQKKELWKLFNLFFVFLAILFAGTVNSTRLQCKHAWAPIALCILGHIIFYVSMAQTLRCINGFRYQRRCHKLTLGLAADKLKKLKAASNSIDSVPEEEFEVPYQEPSQSYINKFKKKWVLFSLFLIVTSCTEVSAIAIILCM